MSKVIRNYIGFALVRSVIDLENSGHPLNQSVCETKPSRDLVTRVFPRLRPVACINFELSLVPCDSYLLENFWRKLALF